MVDALDPDTGRRLWRFDPRIDVTGIANRTCRGVAFAKAGSGICAERIIVATLDAALWALDPKTGRACAGFGVGGRVDLSIGMGNISGGYYYPTSAPTIVRDKIIIGGWVTDGQRTQSPPGVVRAYDLKRGTLAWSWDTGRPGVTTAPRGTAKYVAGTPNVWAPPSSDEALGLVFLPTGNAGPDYFNPERSAAAEYFASSVVALDATTGVVRWRFQTVHHDVWDYDVGSQPTLVDIPLHGRSIPALVQATKRGQIFVLDRRTGRPVVPVIERAVPQRRYLNEQLSPTQPFSAEPSVAGPLLTEASMWGLTPLDQLWCRIRFRQARYEGEMTPPGLMPSIEYPGFMGAVSWGSIAIDPRRSVAIVSATRMPTCIAWFRVQRPIGLACVHAVSRVPSPDLATGHSSVSILLCTPLASCRRLACRARHHLMERSVPSTCASDRFCGNAHSGARGTVDYSDYAAVCHWRWAFPMLAAQSSPQVD